MLHIYYGVLSHHLHPALHPSFNISCKIYARWNFVLQCLRIQNSLKYVGLCSTHTPSAQILCFFILNLNCIAKINDYLTHDLYGGTVWLIWVCKVIFTSNPTEGQVRLYCGWSWGFDNNILMKHNLLYSTKPYIPN